METQLNKPGKPGDNAPTPAETPIFSGIQSLESQVDPRRHLKKNAATKIDCKRIDFYYSANQALFEVTLPIRERQTTTLVGPGGCGETHCFPTLKPHID